LSLEADGAAMLLHHDRVDEGEPLSGAAPDLLGGEEGVEDAPADLFGDPRPGVAHADLDRITCPPGADGDRPPRVGALRHTALPDGVGRVYVQVQDRLVDLARQAG